MTLISGVWPVRACAVYDKSHILKHKQPCFGPRCSGPVEDLVAKLLDFLIDTFRVVLVLIVRFRLPIVDDEGT